MLRNAILFLGLFAILGLLYLKVHVDNSIIISARFRPDMRMYYKSDDMHGSYVEDELPNVKFGGMSVKYMYLFLTILYFVDLDEILLFMVL